MEAEITITLKATESQARRILAVALESASESSNDNGSSQEPTAEAISRFLENLTPDGRRVVRAIAEHSARGERIYQVDLMRELEIEDEKDLFGYLGGVGKVHSRVFGPDNPFARKWDAERERGYYVIDHELAASILEELVGILDSHSAP